MSQSIHFQYNPLAFHTTRNLWNNNKSSLPIKLPKLILAAAHDIYVKNPYDLIIGNCKNLINSTQPLSIKTKITVSATIAFSSLYTLILYGTAIHLSGRCLLSLGNKTGLNAMSKVGEISKTFGKNVFLAGAVPIYAFVYVVPKHIANSVPKAARLITEKVSFAANWVFKHFIIPIWEKALLPAIQGIVKGLRFVTKKIDCVLKKITDLVTSSAKWIFQHILTPLWNKTILPTLKCIKNAFRSITDKISFAAIWVFKHVITPILEKAILPAIEAFSKGLQFVVKKIDFVLKKISDLVASSTQWVFQHVLAPLWNKGIAPILNEIKNVAHFALIKIGSALHNIGLKVGRTASWIFEYTIVPAWNNFVLPTLQATARTLHFVAKAASQSAQIILRKMIRAASFVLKNIVSPIFKIVSENTWKAGKIVFNHVIKPLGSLLSNIGQRVAHLFELFVNIVIIPISNVVTSGFRSISIGLSEVTTEIVQTVTFVWNRMAQLI
ncbi:MAG: hypothetical protein WCG42_01900 [Parachlamydiaceae bacterium]